MNVVLTLLLFVLAPLAPEDPPIALTGATLLTAGDAEALEGATVVVRGGRIEALGVGVEIPWDARLVDASGLVITPAFVDGSHHLPLAFGPFTVQQGRPVDDGRDVLAATLDANRRGLVPEHEAWRALPSSAADRSAHREAGFAALLVSPDGAWLAGTSAWLAANSRPPREALLAVDVTEAASLTYRAGPDDYEGTNYPATLMGIMAHLRQVLLDAQRHGEMLARAEAGRAHVRPVQDGGLDALQPVLSGELPLVVTAQVEEDIRLVLRLADEFPGLRVVIAGGREAWELADELATRGVGVIHDGDVPEEPKLEVDDAPSGADRAKGPWRDAVPQALRDERHRLWLERASGPARLLEAGVSLAFGSFGRAPSELVEGVRRCIEKGGLEKSAALVALCEGPRQVLGASAPEGRLAPGAWAGLVAWKGDVLDEKAKVALVVSDGVLFDLRDSLPKDDAAEDDEKDGETGGKPAGKARRGKADAEPQDDPAALVDAQPSGDAPLGDEAAREAQTPSVAIVGEATHDASVAGDDAAAQDDEAPGEPVPMSSYRRALVAALSEAPDDVSFPVEVASDREVSFHTGGNVLVRGATIFTEGPDGILHDADLLVRDGKIVALGQGLTAPEGVTVVEAAGRSVIPGIIDCHAHIAIRGGINEWTRNLTPEVTIEDEVDPDDLDIYRSLAGGVTSARLLHGSANAIGGRHEVIKLRWGKSAPELVFEGAPRGVKFALGENPRQANWGNDASRFPKTRSGVELSLRRAFEEARRYADERDAYAAAKAAGDDPDPPRRDLRLEALAGILSGDIAVHSHCYRAHEVLMLIRIAEDFGFKVATFQHVLEGYKVAREIGAHGGRGCSTFIDWWGFKFEAYDAIPYNPALVHEAGVPMSINSDSSDHIRRLYLEAAKAVRYGGVPEEDALAMVTRVPAVQLGIGDRVGSLEVGKDADFAIFSRHPFDTATVCESTFVDGELYFERRAGRYESWEDELARRVEVGRAAAATDAAASEQGVEDARLRAVGQEHLFAVRLPRDATRAASTPTRAPAAPMALVGGTVHTMDGGRVLEGGAVLVRDGRIVEVRDGPVLASALEMAGYAVTDCTGLHVWPGMIDAGSGVGLGEISLVNQSMDVNERGGDQADLRTSTGYHPASDLIAVTRVAGITTALVEPGGGGLQGQSALMALEGWTASEAVVRDAVGMHMGAPRVARDADSVLTDEHDDACGPWCETSGADVTLQPQDLTAGRRGRGKDDGGDLDEKVADAWKSLRHTLADAREYLRRNAEAVERGVNGPTYDPRLEALAPYVTRAAPFIVAANGAAQIADALDFADEEGIDLVISGGRDAWQVADRLALADVPVIVGPVNAMPSSGDVPYDSQFANAGLLQRAGVRIGFRSGTSHSARDLPFEAAQAVAFGLDADAALHALTAGNADILGVGDEVGRIRPGLRADLFVTDGSPLQITSRIAQVVIGGRDVGLRSKHTRLYDEYRARLHDPSLPSR